MDYDIPEWLKITQVNYLIKNSGCNKPYNLNDLWDQCESTFTDTSKV
jgi:hypothetical protein